jgi:signal transduction histidine kinase/CheY-like chemotaxis protein
MDGEAMRNSKAPIFSMWAAFDGFARVAAFTAAFVAILLQLVNVVQAQEHLLDPRDTGEIGFAGMLAGLLMISLATLALRHRHVGSMSDRVAKLEATIEERDDRIWALEEQLNRTNQFANAQGDLVVREDALGRITHASEKFASLLDKPIGSVIGHTVALDVRQERNRVAHPDGSISFDQKIVTPDGWCWIAWKEVAVRDENGRLVETQRVGRDVTTRVTAEHVLADAHEKSEAASRAKSRFLAIVSHEVRTPLNGVLGMADLLLETGLSPEQQTYARAMKTSGEALLALIEEILDFSKIEAGRLDLESVPFEPNGLVTDVVELLSPRAQGKGIEIAAYVDDQIPVRVMGDAARLRQVLLNLAGNAVKFTDSGGVSVLVERSSDGRIQFSVRDTGPGIGPEMQARIFDEFEQGDGTLGRRHGGTGLGLAIAARIVERMGGEIALHSAIERGSIFSFAVDLPAVAGSEIIPPPDLSGRDILIASPSPVVGPLLERRLSAWGANVTLANEVRVAETLLPEREWSHLMVDRAFGIVGTVSLAHRAASHTRQRLVLLGPAERAELTDLKSAGFDGYFVKPVRGASLATRLASGETEATLVPDFDADDAAARPHQRALAVLVAEDNDINALLAQAMLGKLGHIPTVVTDGVSAVSAVEAAYAMGAPYDLVLMDLHLPGMNGLEATRRIRAMGEKGGQVPIIALTANAFAEDREACREAGMNAFIVKPFDRDRLDEAIAAARGTRAGQKTHAA